MGFSYFMSRYSTDLLYTFEFLIIILVFSLLLILTKKSGEKNSLMVYLLTGGLHTGIELVAEGTGVRVITETYLFGTLYISYPFLPIILGFFEGGLFCLIAYHFVRMILNRDRFSFKFFSVNAVTFLILTTLGAIGMQTASSSVFTRREIFHTGPLILLTICFAVSIGYFSLNKKISPSYRKSLLYFYIGLIVVTIILVLPLHIFGIRFIEVYQEGSYLYASILEQILVFYGYSIAFEAAGFFLPFWILIYYFKLFEIK